MIKEEDIKVGLTLIAKETSIIGFGSQPNIFKEKEYIIKEIDSKSYIMKCETSDNYRFMKKNINKWFYTNDIKDSNIKSSTIDIKSKDTDYLININ